MMDDLAPPSPPNLYQGRQACIACLREVLCGLGASNAVGLPRAALLVDADFTDWPLGEPAVLDALARWLRPPGRLLRLVALDYEALARAHPRLARWRRDWSHRIEAWRPGDGVLPDGVRGLQAGATVLQRLDAADWRLRRITDPVHRQAMHEACADFLQRCEPAWPVTILGL